MFLFQYWYFMKKGLIEAKQNPLNGYCDYDEDTMRKVVGDKESLSVLSADRGFVFNPSKISF